MAFKVPDVIESELRASHKDFFCPSGHKQFFPGESDVERLTRLLKYYQDLAEERLRRIARLENRLRATRAWVTRYRRALGKP